MDTLANLLDRWHHEHLIREIDKDIIRMQEEIDIKEMHNDVDIKTKSWRLKALERYKTIGR